MILSISNSKRIVLVFSIFHFLFSIQAIAQIPAGIDPNNLSTVKVDELSDDQIKLILKNSGTSGISIEQGSAIAIQRGLPASEVEKLKLRIAKLQSSTNAATSTPATNNVADQINNANNIKEQTTYINTDAVLYNKPNNTSTIYGQSYFRNGDIKIFDKSTDAKAPSNYIIGIGDEFGVSVFGSSFYNEVLKVDSRGAINPNQMGPIFVKGLTFEKAKALVKSKMNQYFDLSNNKIEVTLAYSRNITVNIIGEVLRPGSYNLPAINSAFNALILAGGPSDIGTLREIQIRRDGKTIKTLDVYQFLNNPKSNMDFYLQDNDYIVVGATKKVVTILGEVQKPGSFELLEKEKIVDLIQYAAGFKSTAYKSKIKVKRNLPKEVVFLEVNMDSLLKFKKDFELFSGDTLLVSPTVNDVFNKVMIKGGVNFPGNYSFKKGDRISDLLINAGGLKFDANLQVAFIVRKGPDLYKQYLHVNLEEVIKDKSSPQNIELKSLDLLTVYSKKDYVTKMNIEVFGEVVIAGKLDFLTGVTLFDAIVNSGGFKIEAENLRVEISRLNYFQDNYVDGQDVRVIVESIQLSSSNIFECLEAKNILLCPFDQIFVRTVPNFMLQENITLNGEVKYPGVYSIKSKNEKISDVIKRAGGLTNFAYPEAATFYRLNILGNYIVLDLESALKNKSSKYNYTLKNGDIISVPTVNDFVSIKGSAIEYVQVTGSLQVNAPFVKNRRANYYINEFGNGFTKDSWRKKTYVIQPNAKVNKTRNYLIFKIYPKVTKGSTIYVAQKVKKAEKIKKESEPFNLNQFLEKTTIKITGLLTLFVLFNQIK
jgi:polysaccharide export outer membrane protein